MHVLVQCACHKTALVPVPLFRNRILFTFEEVYSGFLIVSYPDPNVRKHYRAKKKRTIRMQSTRDVTIRVQSVNKLHGYLNSRDNGTVYFAYQRP